MPKACSTAAAGARAAAITRPAADPAAAAGRAAAAPAATDAAGSSGSGMKPRVAITAGDPAGIGPEAAAKAAPCPRVLAAWAPIVSGSPSGTAVIPGQLRAAAGRAAYDVIVRAVDDA